MALSNSKLSRRDTLLGGVGLGLCGALSAQRASAEESVNLTLTDLSDALGAGKITSVDIAERVIARAKRYEFLGVFTSLNEDQLLKDAAKADRQRRSAKARGQTLSPLHGIPIALKDNIDAVGHATTGGTPALRHHLPKKNAPIIERLTRSGALVAGKVNMHELAGGGTTNNPAFQRTRNPYNPEHSPGGSSGGSAVAVAADIVPAALGTDTAGSVRNPAGYCGVVGFRPSMGRYPSAGIVPLALTRDTAGPLAHSVADVVALDEVLAQDTAPAREPSLKGPRIGIPRAPFRDNMTPDIARMLENVELRLKDAGAVLVDGEIPDLMERINQASLVTLGARLRRDVEEYLSYSGASVTFDQIAEQIADPFVKGWMTPFLNPSADILNEEIRVSADVIPALKAAYQGYLTDNRLDAILFPTTPIPAGIEVPGTEDVVVDGAQLPGGIWLNIQNATPASLWGGPGISLPSGLTPSGLPMGVELDGGIGDDRKLLGLAMAVEHILPPTPPPNLSGL